MTAIDLTEDERTVLLAMAEAEGCDVHAADVSLSAERLLIALFGLEQKGMIARDEPVLS